MKTNNRPVEMREPIYLGRSPVNVDNLAVDMGQLRGRRDGIATAPPESEHTKSAPLLLALLAWHTPQLHLGSPGALQCCGAVGYLSTSAATARPPSWESSSLSRAS